LNVDEWKKRWRDCAEEYDKNWKQRYGNTPLRYFEEIKVNPEWQEMGLLCPWEHCIENMGVPDPKLESPAKCPHIRSHLPC